MKDKEYQTAELKRHAAQMADKRGGYFDTVADFSERMDDEAYNMTQLEWIENGSYGAGACFALQRVVAGLNSRTNDVARVGRFFLSVMYGKDFPHWRGLSQKAQEATTAAVEKWLAQDHQYAQTLID